MIDYKLILKVGSDGKSELVTMGNKTVNKFDEIWSYEAGFYLMHFANTTIKVDYAADSTGFEIKPSYQCFVRRLKSYELTWDELEGCWQIGADHD